MWTSLPSKTWHGGSQLWDPPLFFVDGYLHVEVYDKFFEHEIKKKG